jgi:2-oxoglutarate ferredoxin oxidoreductase subunit delta
LAHVLTPTVAAQGRGGRVRAAFRPLDLAPDRCKGCGLCVAACPHAVLELDPATVNALGHHPVAVVDVAACTSCALCARVCPDAVIDVYAKPRGTLP